MKLLLGSWAVRSLMVSLGWMAFTLQAQDEETFCYAVSTPDILSKDFTEAQGIRKQAARSDLDLEKSLLANGYYWVNGHWVKKGQPVVAARRATDLVDSDGDGFDDFTEIKFHADPFKAESTPEAYFRFRGSNQVTFYGTNATAYKK